MLMLEPSIKTGANVKVCSEVMGLTLDIVGTIRSEEKRITTELYRRTK